MIVDIEKKALWVREQQEEHKRVQAAYAQIAAGYEGVQAEKRTLQLRVRQAEAQSRQEDHLRRFASRLLEYPGVCFHVRRSCVSRQGLRAARKPTCAGVWAGQGCG